MQYQLLGKSDLLVSRIAFGCMSIGKQPDSDTLLLQKAFDAGINLFDTADLYDKGANEILVGQALQAHRQKIILATKVGNQWKPDGSGWVWNARKDYILSAVDESLRRLQTDYIDLYQLHGGTIQDNINEAIEAFEILKQQGKIRYYGISSIRPNTIRSWVSRSSLCSVMMQYSLLDRRPEESCFSLLKDNQIGVLARGSLASGLLIDKAGKSYLNHSEKQVADAAKAIQSLSGPDRDAAAIALQFVLSQPAITSAVVGIRTEAQLKAALDAVNTAPLLPEELSILRESISTNYYTEHR